MQTLITHATLVMEDHYCPDAFLWIRDGKIADFGPMRQAGVAGSAPRLNVQGALVGPGLIDIHTHAGGNVFFQDSPAAASRALLEHGVTGVLPALYMTLSKREYFAALDAIDAAREAGQCDNILGYYMEGPYLNPLYGCNKESYPWGEEIRPEDYLSLIDRVRGSAMVWALAPERKGIVEFARDVAQKISGIVLSVAHSEATPQQIAALMPYGLRLGTHHTNATGTLNKYPECRGVCVDEAVNYYDGIYAELIVDAHGIHVDPFMLRLVRKIKGDARIVLISDAFVSDGPTPPGYDGVTDINFDSAGEIAGTRLTLDAVCRNMMLHTGCSPVDVFRFAATNPANLLNRRDLGRIARGAQANLVVVDPWLHVKHVFLKGELFV